MPLLVAVTPTLRIPHPRLRARMGNGVGGGGLAQGLGIRLFAFGGAYCSHHCSFRPSVGPNVFWLCQRSPRMTCPV